MAYWFMILGILTLVNITMVAALISLMGNIPDGPFLAIASRYLRRKADPPGSILYPLEAAARLERLRRRALAVAGAAALVAAGLSIWALAVGWGTVALLAITAWFAAGNLAFLDLPLGTWRRRAGKMREEAAEEAWRKTRPPGEAGGSHREGFPTGEENLPVGGDAPSGQEGAPPDHDPAAKP